MKVPLIIGAAALLLLGLLLLVAGRKTQRTTCALGLAIGAALATYVALLNSCDLATAKPTISDAAVITILSCLSALAGLAGFFFLWAVGWACIGALGAGSTVVSCFLMASQMGPSQVARWVLVVLAASIGCGSVLLTKWTGMVSFSRSCEIRSDRRGVKTVATSLLGGTMLALAFDLFINGKEGLPNGITVMFSGQRSAVRTLALLLFEESDRLKTSSTNLFKDLRSSLVCAGLCRTYLSQ